MSRGRDYEDAGVRTQGDALTAVKRHLEPTLGFAHTARVLTRFGHFASVLQVAPDLAIALCTDGVGTKTMIASALDSYATIGFDCVAMNANDLVCVGARPIALVDYLGVNTLDPARLDGVLEGLGRAAKEAGISIPGGELAQLPEVIGSNAGGPGDERAFDLVGTCVGTLRPSELLLGTEVAPGDALIGVASSGLHSNGFTLARRALLGRAGLRLEDEVAEIGRTLGEELLEPTLLYVSAVTGLWDRGIATKGIVHITGDGLANLCRLEAPAGYALEELLPIPPIFDLIQRAGDVDDAEMFRVFNMGIGLVIVVSADDGAETVDNLSASGHRAARIGTVTARTGVVEIEPRSLAGGLGGGDSVFRPV
ncbi:MAG: phosphoribosylformylglycinamidine cyclo-ligase [Actinobacteria bacterium]|nr:phosphoribosylformylglycinamidine cyclo-ligase [Actinomycetota bacterium]